VHSGLGWALFGRFLCPKIGLRSQFYVMARDFGSGQNMHCYDAMLGVLFFRALFENLRKFRILDFSAFWSQVLGGRPSAGPRLETERPKIEDPRPRFGESGIWLGSQVLTKMAKISHF